MLYPTTFGKPTYKIPNIEYIYREKQRDGVTLDLLWREYVEECHRNGELPYISPQFNKLYNDILHIKNATMHPDHNYYFVNVQSLRNLWSIFAVLMVNSCGISGQFVRFQWFQRAEYSEFVNI